MFEELAIYYMGKKKKNPLQNIVIKIGWSR